MFVQIIKSHKIIFLAALAFILFFLHPAFLRIPPDFPEGKTVTIPEGITLREVSELLGEEGVISSPFYFSVLTTVLFQGKAVSGAYFFKSRLPVFFIVLRVARGDYRADFARIVFWEGTTVKDMALECARYLPNCKEDEFIALGKEKEGYLFPDTYLFLPTGKADQVIEAMEKNFKEKIKTLDTKIKELGKPLSGIIIMASIIEGEAGESEDRRVVAGILWKRLQIGMPLQVDAAFRYINGKTTFELSEEDLKIDSPYNTYRYTGLPPTPINNPGLDAIEAAISPTETPYLFYLTDSKGNFHYANDHKGHLKNKALYLK